MLPNPSRLPIGFADWFDTLTDEEREYIMERIDVWLASLRKSLGIRYPNVVGQGRDDAFEDMAQVIFTTVWSEFVLRSEHWIADLGSYVKITATNFCLTATKPRKTHPFQPVDGESGSHPELQIPAPRPTDPNLELREFAELFYRVLPRMSDPSRTVMFLRSRGKSTNWIADTFRQKIANVNSNWYHRARKELEAKWIEVHGASSWHLWFPGGRERDHGKDKDNDNETGRHLGADE